MKQQLTERLETLRSEFGRGQERLTQLETEAGQLRETLLRIAGAIQVLEEELAREAESGDGRTGTGSREAGVAA